MTYLVLDLELTGTEPGWHEIIQIGAVLCDDNWKELGRFLTNVYPENEESFSQPAEEVHQLSLADLEDAPMLYEALEDLENWMAKTLHIRQESDRRRSFRDIVICGQSVVYDVNFLKFAYRDVKMEWPFANGLVDLYNLSWFVFPILARHGAEVPRKRGLADVARFFGYQRGQEAHNALEDCLLTVHCLREFTALQQRLSLDKA